jgi:hypothetical protein
MTYSLTRVTNLADCNSLIESAEMEHEEIVFRKQQQERQYKGISNGTVGVDSELAAVNAEIESIEPIVASLPDGQLKKDFQVRLTKLNFKKFNLELRKDQYGILALLGKEFEINCTVLELVESTAYIAALEARKLQL